MMTLVSDNDENQFPPADPMAVLVRGHGFARLSAERAANDEMNGICSRIQMAKINTIVPTISRRAIRPAAQRTRFRLIRPRTEKRFSFS